MDKPDCIQHKRDLFTETDMNKVAENIGNLHYEVLTDLLYELSKKMNRDANKDNQGGRPKLASALQYLGMSLFECSLRAEKVWKISKPFMEQTKNDNT